MPIRIRISCHIHCQVYTLGVTIISGQREINIRISNDLYDLWGGNLKMLGSTQVLDAIIQEWGKFVVKFWQCSYWMMCIVKEVSNLLAFCHCLSI